MYGDNPEHPQNEETRLMPASPYACAKVFAHGLTRNYREGYGIHASSGILFNHESPRRGETFVTRKITLAAARIKLGLQDRIALGNLDALRDWGYAKDYVEAMWLMLQQDRPDDYVVATGETHTVREFLNEVFEIAGLEVDKHLIIDDRLKRPHEVPWLEGDYSKARKKLGWEPKTTFKGLAKLMYEADLELVKKLNN
jgi:GDPmannose 4,6-dehydratase